MIIKDLIRLSGQDTYTLNKPSRRNFKRNPILTQYVGDLFEFDLAEMRPAEQRDRKKYKYFFVGVDVFSRFAFGMPLHRHKPKDIVRALNAIAATGYEMYNAMADRAGMFSISHNQDSHKNIVYRRTYKRCHRKVVQGQQYQLLLE